MIRLTATLVVVLGLAACGVDGEPERPERGATSPITVSVTGTVEMGVSGSH